MKRELFTRKKTPPSNRTSYPTPEIIKDKTWAQTIGETKTKTLAMGVKTPYVNEKELRAVLLPIFHTT